MDRLSDRISSTTSTRTMVSISAQHLKYFSLVVLVLQTSAFVLVARRSRKPDENGHIYNASTAVFFMEFTKMAVSALVILTRSVQSAKKEHDLKHASAGRSSGGFEVTSSLIGDVLAQVYDDLSELLSNKGALQLIIPATAYVIQNNLQLVASSYLEPALFQTFSQAKLITTAFFSIIIMKRIINKRQWFAVAMLAFGLAVVQQTGGDSKVVSAAKVAASSASSAKTFEPQNVTYGFLIMMAASTLSGFAGVFTEKVLKKDNEFWATNFYMAGFSLVPSTVVLLMSKWNDPTFVTMQGFGGWAVATVMLNAFGGLLVSMVLKYADSIAKGFSLAAAAVLTTFINTFFFHVSFTMGCLFGIVTVLVSINTYIMASVKPSPSPKAEDEAASLALPNSPREGVIHITDTSLDESYDESLSMTEKESDKLRS